MGQWPPYPLPLFFGMRLATTYFQDVPPGGMTVSTIAVLTKFILAGFVAIQEK